MHLLKGKIIIVLLAGALVFQIASAQAALNLNGRILLQVQDKGQAWYVNPLNSQRYYLGRPDDAFNLMRSLGLGITNADADNFLKNGAPLRLSGRILLQVQDKGQAYYVDPQNLRLSYLGRPADAFNLMRSRGLGITNADLALIAIFQDSPASSAGVATAHDFTFKYQNNSYQISQDLSAAWYSAYKDSPKVYTYSSANEPANLREAFYGLFLQSKAGDSSLDDLVSKMKAIASRNNWTSDQLAEFTLAFVQSIPYDHAKLAADNNRNTDPYYPYETLYLDRGVCSDKTFLAVALLRRLGFGAAILDFPDANHSAAGIACPVADSVNGSGYCYGETTNYFPLGVVSQSISAGQAQTAADEFTNLFSAASLGRMEIYQKTSGKTYDGVADTKNQVAYLKASKDDLSARQIELNSLEADLRIKEADLSAMKTNMDNYYNSGQTDKYNNLVPDYNNLVNQYNAALANYQAKINEYNQKAASFNQAVKNFYQK